MDTINFLEKSPTLGELFGALAQAQAELGSAHKSSANPFFKSKYADLAEVISVIKPVAHKYGLSYAQFPYALDCLATYLGHKSGEYICAIMSMKPVKNDPQGQGSCITYMRRYALQSIFGIPAEDDDGNAASSPVTKPLSNKPLYTEEQEEKILQGIKDKYKNDAPAMSRALGFYHRPATHAEWLKAYQVSGVKL